MAEIFPLYALQTHTPLFRISCTNKPSCAQTRQCNVNTIVYLNGKTYLQRKHALIHFIISLCIDKHYPITHARVILPSPGGLRLRDLDLLFRSSCSSAAPKGGRRVDEGGSRCCSSSCSCCRCDKETASGDMGVRNGDVSREEGVDVVEVAPA